MIAETGLAVSGPNCMGNICAKSRLVTLTEDRELTLRQGPVALVGQSGGMLLYLNVALEERGISAEYLITSGNEAGLGIPDYVAFFADQPELKVILLYIEAIWDLEKFKAACRMARKAGKSIVAVKLGSSEEGRAAAMAHTGSLAGTMEAFDAVAADLGVIRASTLDDAVEFTEFLVHTDVPKGRRLGAVTHSGAFRGVLLRPRSATGCRSSRSPPKPRRDSTPCSASARWSATRSMAGLPCCRATTISGPRSRPLKAIRTSTWFCSRKSCRSSRAVRTVPRSTSP